MKTKNLFILLLAALTPLASMATFRCDPRHGQYEYEELIEDCAAPIKQKTQFKYDDGLNAKGYQFENTHGVKNGGDLAKILKARLVAGNLGSVTSLRLLADHPLLQHLAHRIETKNEIMAEMLNSPTKRAIRRLKEYNRLDQLAENLFEKLNIELKAMRQAQRQKRQSQQRHVRDLQGSLFQPVPNAEPVTQLDADNHEETKKNQPDQEDISVVHDMLEPLIITQKPAKKTLVERLANTAKTALKSVGSFMKKVFDYNAWSQVIMITD